jgi:hypothetical protein
VLALGIEERRVNESEAGIAAGLTAHERVVLHPSDRVRDGVRVVSRDD